MKSDFLKFRLLLHCILNKIRMVKSKYIFLIIILTIIIVTAPPSQINKVEQEECPIKTELRTVWGSSLSPFINSGDKIKILFKYYNCYEIKREDIVLYNFAGNENPLIKIVKGVPGDKFELRKSDSGWNILINNQILKNSKSEPYVISRNRYKMLSLYESDYKGVIPKNAYLLLGNLVSGSVDSTRFGLVDKSNIIGKVEFLNNEV